MKNIQNQNGFQVLFMRLYPKLIALACRFVDENVAKDIVQDVFISYWEKQKNIHENNVHSYLFKCVQNKCLDTIKHKTIVEEHAKRVRIAEARMDFISRASDSNEILDVLEKKDIREIVEVAINKLPPKCQQAFRLCFFYDMTYKEAAEVLEVSHRTVETHVHKAISFLREELNPLLFINLLAILANLDK